MEEFIRDYAMYALIFGFFGFSWFGWAQDSPPKSWRPWLGAGSGIALVIALIGGFLAYTNWSEPSALAVAGTYETFGIIVAIEFSLALIGSLFLLFRKKAQYIASWISFVVGIHFIPLAPILHDALLYVLAVCMVGVSVVSVLYNKQLKLTATTIACAGSGLLLVVYALCKLLQFFMVS